MKACQVAEVTVMKPRSLAFVSLTWMLAALLATSTQLPPLPPLAFALTHFKLSLTAVHS
jgi:hypothetical protein